VQNYRPLVQTRFPQHNPTMHIAQIGYDSTIPTNGELIDDYVENVHGELIPMCYTIAQLRYRLAGKMSIRCFGYGGPHRKVDCPNRMTPGTFIPLCDDYGLGHHVSECPLRVQVQTSQAPLAPINMIRTMSHPHIVPINVVTRSRDQAQGIVSQELLKPKETSDPQVDKVIPLEYMSAKVELERLKAL